NIMSAATLAAGPVAANSWVTIFGTNLSATTRSWSEGDFTNGAMPYALDGVSVIFSQFGAPRSAYVGYVSPTQINFLVPTDAQNTATTISVKNPAGTSAPLPLAVAENTPLLFTVVGKRVHATLASDAIVGKSSLFASG